MTSNKSSRPEFSKVLFNFRFFCSWVHSLRNLVDIWKYWPHLDHLSLPAFQMELIMRHPSSKVRKTNTIIIIITVTIPGINVCVYIHYLTCISHAYGIYYSLNVLLWKFIKTQCNLKYILHYLQRRCKILMPPDFQHI